MKEIDGNALGALIRDSKTSLEIVDVREPAEYAEVRVTWSKNLPLSGLSADTKDIDWSKTVVFVCRSWARSGRVTAAFEELWKSASNLVWGVAGLAESHPELLEFPN